MPTPCSIEDMVSVNHEARGDISSLCLDDESIAKIVFLRLDPVLRMLLSAVKEYHSFVKNEEMPGVINNEQREIYLLQMICQMLLSVKRIVEDNNYSYHGYSLNDDHVGRSLLLLFDYLSLPLLAILRMPTTSPSCDKLNSNQQLIRKSASCKCVQLASQTIQATIERIYKIENSSSTGRQQELLPHKMIIKSLSACAASLPSGEEIIVERRKQVISLDSNEGHAQSVLEAVCSIVENCAGKAGLELTTAMDGALLTRILDCAVAYIEPETDASAVATPKSGTESASRNIMIPALRTIQTLLQVSCNSHPSPRSANYVKIWYKVFPGVYAGLYRRTLQSISVSRTKGSEIVALSVETICLLLTICLDVEGIGRQELASPTVSRALESLRKLSTQKARENLPFNGDNESNEFYDQLFQRVPSTLITLINLLSSAKSASIRQQAVNLDRVVLVNAGSYWSLGGKQDSDTTRTNDLITFAIESCLVLSRDDNEGVAATANDILHAYSAVAWRGDDVGDKVAPRIIALIESLPTLAQRKIEIEFKSTLKLISGYLAIILSQKKLLKVLRACLITESTFRKVRKSFTFILDVDFGTSTADDGALVVVVSQTDSRTQDIKPALRYLSKEVHQQVIYTIRSLGKVLGPKHASVYSDNCVASLYEGLVGRLSNVQKSTVDLIGYSQIIWLHETIGSISFVQEILIGSFFNEPDIPIPKKESKTRQQCLEIIAKSMLPIITSHPLWDLPTVANIDTSQCELSSSITTSDSRATTSSVHTGVPLSSSLRGNTYFIGLLLDLVGCIFELLGTRGFNFVSNVLFPVIERSSSLNPHAIRRISSTVLEQLVVSCNAASISAMLVEEIAAIVAALFERLRIPGGKSLTRNDYPNETITCALCTATSSFHLLFDPTTKIRDQSFPLSSIEAIADEFMNRFDFASTQMQYADVTPIRFLNLFDSAILLLLQAYGFLVSEDASLVVEPLQKGSAPWYDLLLSFEKDDLAKLSPKEGFEKIRNQKKKQSVVASDRITAISSSLVRDTSFASKIALRCCYTMSHQSLRVQVTSCDVLAKCFLFLGRVASDTSIASDEANGPKTAILRLIHASWPAIVSRLKATTSALNISGNTCLVLVSSNYGGNPLQRTNMGEQRVFLSKLYNLIAGMAECADDFMATRFRQVVWPCIGVILGHYIGNQHRNRLRTKVHTEEANFKGEKQELTYSDKNLVQSVIRCIRRVFRHRPAGEALSGLIPSVGVLLFPFLESNDDEIVFDCIEALKSMFRIDCDAMYGFLLTTSGKNITRCPLRISYRIPDSDHTKSPRNSSKLARIAGELLHFIESLPEQIIIF